MTDRKFHPLVEALIAEIPVPPGPWPESLRDLWLRAAAATFDLVYGKGEAIMIGSEMGKAIESTLERDRKTVWIDTDTAIKVVKEPVKPVKEEVAAEAPPSVERDDVPAERRNVGGRPKSTGPHRPAGIPTNLQMALEAIDSKNGKATAGEILAFVRYTHWDGAPQNWTASLYDQVTAGKLVRDGSCFCRPTKAVEKAPQAKVGLHEAIESSGDDFKDRMTQAISASPTLEPVSRPQFDVIKFEYGGKATMLSKTSFRLAEALRRAMGKGHLDYAYLMQAGTAGQQRKAGLSEKVWCMEAVADLRPRVALLGLDITHSPNFGYTMHAAVSD